MASPTRTFLRDAQNSDGGWGYLPGKHSWLEPTVYAILALEGDFASSAHVDRAWKLIRSWSLPEGGWRTGAEVREPNWTSALCLTLHTVRGFDDKAVKKTVNRLLETAGAESGWRVRLSHFLDPAANEIDCSLSGWPWLEGASSWVEPTAHTLVALRRAARCFGPEVIRDSSGLEQRVDMARKMLLDRRCEDGGWNYGNRKVLGTALPSYPETTAVALLGLRGFAAVEMHRSVELARRQSGEAQGPLAKAWLAICLRNYGLSPMEQPSQMNTARRDVLVAALQCLGEPGGNYRFLAPEAA